jgi:4-hydroxy-L-threonine phosphate dehydrogenase PdxA
MKKKILIIGGDPNSINSEIIFKSWKKINLSIKKKIYLITNYNLIRDQFKKLKFSIKLQKVKSLDEVFKNEYLKIIDLPALYKDPFNISKRESSKLVTNSLDLAHKLCVKHKNIAGIINCPIDKSLFKKSKIGVTEYLAFKCGLKNNSEVMLIKNKKLSIAPITTHINLNQVSKKITKKTIIRKVTTINNWYIAKLKYKPKICILGLNPHNAELRSNSEEKKEILPAIKKLEKNKISISGPLPADTVFIEQYKKFDVIVGMYHDQILPSFKTLFKFDAINVTLGLKYLRVSPDHGVAKQLIKKNKANPLSLINCIKFVNKFGL